MIDSISIRYLPGYNHLYIRELCGKDEQSVRGTRSNDAIRLLKAILVTENDSEKLCSSISKLPVSDRDRILAAVYFNTYGKKVSSVLYCSNCEMEFDIDFSLGELMEKLEMKTLCTYSEKDSAYVFTLNDKVKFRLPTGEDELAAMELSANQAESEILRRCLIEDNKRFKSDELQKAMQDVAPLIDATFETQCPECGTGQNVHFNLQHYLLSSLIQEQKQLIYEVHQIARTYGWGLNEILELPRSIRRLYVSLIEA